MSHKEKCYTNLVNIYTRLRILTQNKDDVDDKKYNANNYNKANQQLTETKLCYEDVNWSEPTEGMNDVKQPIVHLTCTLYLHLRRNTQT